MVYCFSLAVSRFIWLDSPLLLSSSSASLTARYLDRWSTVALPEVLMYLQQQPHRLSIITEQLLWEKPSGMPRILNVSCEKDLRDSSQLKLRIDWHTKQRWLISTGSQEKTWGNTTKLLSAVSQNLQSVLGWDYEQKKWQEKLAACKSCWHKAALKTADTYTRFVYSKRILE